MPFVRRFPVAAIVCVGSALLGAGPLLAQAPPPAPKTLDQQLMEDAQALNAAGKYSEAAAKYDELVQKYPQVPLVPLANFKGGYAHYLAGEYDEAIQSFKRVLDAKNLPADMAPSVELSQSMTAQTLAAKAAKMQPEDQRRKTTREEAVKQFDAYLTKYPNSDEAESATLTKSTVLFQLDRFDEAIAALRGNLTKFARSLTIQESQYLLALTLASVANTAKQKAAGPDPAADAQFDESEKLLRDIIAKQRSFALVNDAQFQIGELLFARAHFLSAPDQKKKQTDMFAQAIDAYRAVSSKDAVVAAQKARIAQFADLRTKALQARDGAGYNKYQRLVDKETEKLASIEERPDQTLTAKFKTGIIYFSEARWDETRVFFTQLDSLGVLDDPNDKKQALYFVTMSYAEQDLADKALEKYKEFETNFANDPIAESLPLTMGGMYLKLNQPTKAIEYFNEGITAYPKGSLLGQMVLARARAQIDLKDFDNAATALKEQLAKKPPKDLQVDAEFYLGTIDMQTGKLPEAVKQFKDVRDNFKGTPQAEQADYQVGQILSEIEPKAALLELQRFLKDFPGSQYSAAALFALGKAQVASKQPPEIALATFTKVATDFASSPAAPYSYFERAKLLSEEKKFDKCIEVMKDFIKKYPDSPSLFQAYDFIAQILTSQSKEGGLGAIATYDEYVEKHPKDASTPEALLKLAALWKGYMDSQGPYLAIDETKRGEWRKGAEKSSAAAERVLEDFPESQQVASALNTLMEVQRLQQQVKLKGEEDITKYFEELAQKFAGKPGTRAKILFTLAAYTYGKDKAKAVEQMKKAYKPDLKFAPEDLDLYGQALIESKQVDEALKIYEKLSEDYKITGDPKTAPLASQEARAIVLAGLGKAYQEKGDAASKEKGGKYFAELEANFPWSPKMLEVNYGIAVSLHEKGEDDDAIKRIQEVIKAQKAPAELRAKSMLLLGKIHEANHRFELAIDNYIKISVFYGGVPNIASEGLWLGGQLLERQASGDIPMPTPTPKPAATPKAPATPKAGGTPKPGGTPKAATPKK